VSRSIKSSGYFDVQTFAKIELPIWQSYCLGAGAATQEAAATLAKKNNPWFSNFYSSTKSKASYIKAGGNGAAMRIQPHVWSICAENKTELINDVVQNTLITHGNANALIGSVFHALTLSHALCNGVSQKEFSSLNFPGLLS
jgi:ADP-ribosylglycohydrolase